MSRETTFDQEIEEAEADLRSVAEMKAEDGYQEGVVKEGRLSGDTWSVSWTEDDEPGTWGCGVPHKEGLEIKPGQVVRFYGRGFGYEFHGVDIDGEEVFYLTPYERIAKRIAWLAEYDRVNRERFERSREDLDRRVAELPAPLRRRIERLRAKSPTFRRDSEAYEMAAVGDAPKIARAIAEKEGWELDGDLGVVPLAGETLEQLADREGMIQRAVEGFRKLSYEEQKAMVPDLDEGHSGNTFGGAVRLAYGLLRGEEL